MGFHTFDADRADNLEDVSRFRYCSRDELIGHMAVGREAVVADLGSGTGFYTDEIAPFVGTVYAVDVQQAMHDYYRSKGLPENVEPVTSDIASLPFADGELDAAVSTMTFHEFATPESLAELHRVTADGGRVVVADWTARGTGDAGPPLDERYDAAVAAEQFRDAGFTVTHEMERPDTFVVVATV
ncbi:class I SAM-dependent methyltransferase [Halomicroarcula sp. GCM10025709]|uniref:class I SAM-dependent methyltransferase n=1 Tax=Haloarcula TaxID=2237 RepID=UPI0024C2341F|nr:class I SAM-dependent methyltransferase [Halomicroarcula sp. YJ-61-S]